MSLEKMVEKEMNSRTYKDRWYTGIAYTDLHGHMQDEASVAILQQYMIDNKKYIKKVIDLGDGVDNPFMSTFAVNADMNISAQEEFDIYSSFLKSLYSIVPNADFYLVAGNHDKARLNNAKSLNRGLASLRNLQYEEVLKESMLSQGINLKKFKFIDGSYDLKVTRNNIITLSHGDPRLDPNIKGGQTGARRTAESYPSSGDIYAGHKHIWETFPRRYPSKHFYTIPMMASIDKMKKAYLSHHPYENGFMIFKYNKSLNKIVHLPVSIIDGTAIIDGTIYSYK